MAQHDLDLIVIGAGSGGVRAARLAAQRGARVAVIEADRPGGTCVIRGCVPKKLLVYSSEVPQRLREAAGYGWSVGEARFDWDRNRADRDREIARLSDLYAANLKQAGARLLSGRGRLVDAHTVLVEGADAGRYTADRILVATGGRPVRPTFPGAEHGVTSDDVFGLPALPRRVLVVGGGYIAVEFAGIFHGLGADTTLLHRGDQLLRGFDDDVAAHLAEELTARGIQLRLGARHLRIDRTADGLVSQLDHGDPITTDLVLFATGRRPATDGLGLAEVGVGLAPNGAVQVDAWSRTRVPSIWAVGDVTDRLNLTPVAIREGAAFAQTEFYDNPTTFDHAHVATAVFSQPPIGVVGLTEADARARLGPVTVWRAAFRPMKTAFYGGTERCLMKLVARADTGQLVGVHVVGPDAPEIIQMAAIAVQLGVTKAQWDATCAVHPTLAEELVTMREPAPPRGVSP